MRGPIRWFAVAITLLELATSHKAKAEPSLEVRARAILETHASRQPDQTVRAEVRLTDDIGAPLPNESVTVSLRDATGECGGKRSCVTDAQGACALTLSGCAAGSVSSTYEGNSDIDGESALVSVLERVSAPRVEVSLPGGTTVDLDALHVSIVLSINGAGSAPTLVTLRDELGQTIATRVVRGGVVPDIDLASAHMGPPGLGAVVGTVTFEDGTEATGRVMVARQRRATITLSQRGTQLTAILSDSQGGIGDAVVSLFEGSSVIGTKRTTRGGVARFAIEPSAASRRVFASFTPNDGAHSSAHSRVLRVAAVRSLHLERFAPLASIALLGVLFALVRRRDGTSAPTTVAESPRPTVELAARRHVVAREMGVRLCVVAAEDGAPVLDARASTDRGAEVFDHDGTGTYSLMLTTSGTVSVLVEAPSRAPERLRVRAPHRGEWNNAVVRLETTRALARRAIDALARAATEDDSVANVLTIREAEAALPASDGTSLAQDAEPLVYGSVPPPLDAAVSLVARARAKIDLLPHD